MPDSLIDKLTEQLDQQLPQTQCGQCGFEGCKPYAAAMARGEAPINRCPPGGAEGVVLLSKVLAVPVIELDASCGQHKPRHIASIAAEHCIGCTLCIKACPVDAIVGGNKRRHAVIASLCTGCELCIPPCPVDCIEMVLLPDFSDWDKAQASAARERLKQRTVRLERLLSASEKKLEDKALSKHAEIEGHGDSPDEANRKRDIIAAALERARARRKIAGDSAKPPGAHS